MKFVPLDEIDDEVSIEFGERPQKNGDSEVIGKQDAIEAQVENEVKSSTAGDVVEGSVEEEEQINSDHQLSSIVIVAFSVNYVMGTV